VSAGAHTLPAALGPSRPTGETVALGPGTALGGREAALRSAATVCLAGIALVQAIELPSVFARGGQFAAASMAAMAICIALGLALSAAPADHAAALWRLVAAAATLVMAGWALPRAFALPGLEPDGYGGQAVVGALDRWASMPGAICAGLAFVCLPVAVVAYPPRRPSPRALATALAVLATLGPGVWVGLVALGPGAVGGEQSLAQGHVHSHAGHAGGVVPEDIEYRPGSGRAGGHYLVSVTPPARHTTLGSGLLIAAASIFAVGAVGYLRRRTAPDGPVVRSLEGRPA
jgi:hypothetical protein